MKIEAVIAVLLLGGIPCPAQEVAATSPAPTAVNPAANPALLYWQAIGMLPELSSEQIRLVPQVLGGKIEVTEEKVTNLLKLVSKSLERFARATAVDVQKCEWGTTFDEGPFAPMPHLPKFQHLCRLTLMRAEALFAKGQAHQALQCLIAVHRATRHMASDALLVTVIMQHGMEQQTLRITAKHVLTLDTGTRAQHLENLRKLPPLRTLRESLVVEHRISEWIRHSVLGLENSPENEKALLDMSKALLDVQSQSKDPSTSESAKQYLAYLSEYKLAAEQAQAVQARLETICDHPWRTFQTGMGQLHADYVQAPVALRSMLTTVEGAKRKELESKSLMTMLEAALTLGDNFSDVSLPGYQDAFVAVPLQVKKDDKGITLSCRDAVNGKVLEMLFPRAVPP